MHLIKQNYFRTQRSRMKSLFLTYNTVVLKVRSLLNVRSPLRLQTSNKEISLKKKKSFSLGRLCKTENRKRFSCMCIIYVIDIEVKMNLFFEQSRCEAIFFIIWLSQSEEESDSHQTDFGPNFNRILSDTQWITKNASKSSTNK